ncbi:aspartate aminotransferase family protein [Sulfodiicoccus acidiphilus]|uniref:Aspartate aminotransferase family protein n=1 Tax=Sulfodiicoccus acidiphilus TaxID=1670455 RepID=A0A830GY88_9CREN|nr:aspartate aminotransferase family protein [Sulfodiicoccus acidiphilus]
MRRAEEYVSRDMDPLSGRMWGHVYVLGAPDVIELGKALYLKFMDKTMLDFTVYPSVLRMENELVGMVSSLLHGDDEVVGNFTYGGTESIILAMKAARERFERSSSGTPEIVLPATAHPAFRKAAEYLGMRVVTVKVDGQFRADLEDVKGKLGGNTVALIASAPNYPFGTVDDVQAMAELALDRGVWFHVDACVGGFLLPFLRELGEDVPPFDFSLEGVSSVSADLHKYGYAPRGASIVLFRNAELREGTVFAASKWPGYPVVNTAVLSTRSAGTLAASWGILIYLGREGYRELAKRVLDARRRMETGLRNLGYKVLGEPKSGILAFTSDERDLAALPREMRKLNWFVQYQPGSREMGFPKSIHLTVAPGHDVLVDQFLKDLSSVSLTVEEEIRLPEGDLVRALGIEEGKLPEDFTVINRLMHEAPPDLVEEVLKTAVNRYLFKPPSSGP